MTKRKVNIIDLSVLLHDPKALSMFPNEDVVIPVLVFEELDKKKRDFGDKGKCALEVLRYFDKVCQQDHIQEGIDLENNTRLFIDLEHDRHKEKDAFYHTADRARNRILQTAHRWQEKGHDVMIVSMDFVTRALSELAEIPVCTFGEADISYSDVYKGIPPRTLLKEDIDACYESGKLDLKGAELDPNSYCVGKCPENSSVILRVDAKDKVFKPVVPPKKPIWGIEPNNVEQKCAMDALLNSDLRIITLFGPAGTGKTLLALVAGLKQVFDDNQYRKLLICRANVPLGREIGFLPGGKEEKMWPWLAAIFDNIDFITQVGDGEDDDETKKWILESKKVEIEAVSYMRGRSLNNTYIIIDEAQNLTPHEVKTIVSRVGRNSKIILTGDCEQIDNAYLGLNNNGLLYTYKRMKKCPFFGHVFLNQTERSEVAEAASQLM
ncbi:MAG: hypothetical protein S4CHLAM102_02900 [Chlamydiia bacterium]|nr:hypothetical protein [Chlamydiia bacterium]